jgi:hypothetical protein
MIDSKPRGILENDLVAEEALFDKNEGIFAQR